MAGQNRVVSDTFTASGDLSAMQHRFVDYLAAGDVIGHSLARGGIGILLNKPLDGEHATVALSGRVRVDAGAAITAGDYIVSAASGFAAVQSFVTINAGSAGQLLQSRNLMGRALDTLASGSAFAMALRPSQALVTSV